MSSTLDGRWIDDITSRAPFTCVSAQGGAKARILRFDPPFKFRLGRTAKATDDTSITRHYTADMKIWECIATTNFKLKPKR